jgi:hypothetical protein
MHAEGDVCLRGAAGDAVDARLPGDASAMRGDLNRTPVARWRGVGQPPGACQPLAGTVARDVREFKTELLRGGGD